jgi:hypothetical protein
MEHTGTSGGGGGAGAAFGFFTTETGSRNPPGTFVPLCPSAEDSRSYSSGQTRWEEYRTGK